RNGPGGRALGWHRLQPTPAECTIPLTPAIAPAAGFPASPPPPMILPSAWCRASLILAVLASAGARAASFIEHAEPPVAQAGNTTRVTFVGHDLEAALDVWASLPAGQVTAKP